MSTVDKAPIDGIISAARFEDMSHHPLTPPHPEERFSKRSVQPDDKNLVIKVNTPQAEQCRQLLKLGVKKIRLGQLDEGKTLFYEILELWPEHARAKYWLGVIATRQGQHPEGVRWIIQAIALEPESATFHSALGDTYKAMGYLDQSIASYQHSLDINATDYQAHHNLALAFHEQDDLIKAVASYQCAIECKPDVPDMHYNLGLAYKAQGESNAAIAAYQQVIALDDQHYPAHNALGAVYKSLGEFKSAISSYRKAIAINPEYASAHVNLGFAYYEQGHYQEAIAAYKQAITLEPEGAEPYYKLGIVYKTLGQLDDAIAVYQKAIERSPDFYQAYNNLGNIYREQEKFQDAIASFQRAIQSHQSYHQAYNNLGYTYYSLGDLEAATTAYQQAIAYKEDFPSAYYNLGIAYHDQGCIGEAIASYKKAIAFNPQYPEALYNLSLSLLLSGDLANGWPYYEWRFQRKENPISSPIPSPMWNGSSKKLDMTSDTILLWSEQGLGDAIQFVRYALVLKEKGYRVAIATYPLLVNLFRNCLTTQFDVVNQYEVDFKLYQHHASLMSLPRIAQTTMATIPTPIPYIQHSEQSLVLPDSEDMKIGIVWGSAINNPRLYEKKSIPAALFLKPFESFLSSGEISLWSLQVGEDSPQIQPWLSCENVHDLSSQLKDFEDTATVIHQLDLVITVDTAVAHLAGAMGKPVWVLLPFVPDWRWLMDRQDSPWYPRMRVFRQPSSGKWKAVVQQVTEALGLVLNGKEQPIFSLDPKSFGIRPNSTTSAPIDGADIEAYFKLGYEYKTQGKYADSLDAYRRVIELNPSHVQAHFNIGNIHRTQGDFGAAIAFYQQVVSLSPNYFQAHNNLGIAYYSAGQLDSAALAYQKAISCSNDSADAHYNLGIVYKDQGKLNDAIASYQRAIELNPSYYQAHHNLGLAYHDLGKYQEAIASYRQSLQLNHNYPEAHFNLGLSLLLTGNLEEGLVQYEWRFKRHHNPITSPLTTQRWQRSSIGEEKLLVWSEQGLGDAIQFVRYVELLKKQGLNVIIATRSPLLRLFRDCFHLHLDVCDLSNTDLSDFQHHVSLMSLPHLMKTTLDCIPTTIPYIHAPQETPASLENADTQSFKIGVVWASAVENYQLYQRKSMSADVFLSPFEDLLKSGQISFWSLQVGPDSQQIKPWLQYKTVIDLSSRLKDFADTASVIAQLDLVITVDTAVAHLAGAMGKTVWILLPSTPDWRWFLERPDSPWYPTMRLFRQSKLEDWNSVLQQVRCALQETLSASVQVPSQSLGESNLDAIADDLIPQKRSLTVIPPPSVESVITTDGFNAVVKAKYGYLLYNKNDLYIGRSVEKYGEFSDFEVQLFQKLIRKNDVVVEVGANIGTHTLPLAQMVGPQGRLYALEPQRIVFQTLCANMALNSVTNVECFQVAAASKNGMIQIPDIQYDREGNFGGVNVQQFKQGREVPKICLDTFLTLENLRLLKVDVEGMEKDVIEGARTMIEHFKPLIYVENDRTEKSEQLINLLFSMGYRLYWHRPSMYNPNNFAGHSENIFRGIVSVNMLCCHTTQKIKIQGLQEVTDASFHPLN